MTQYYVARKIVLAWPQEKDGQEGYAVKYNDGYISWCPKAKFEEDNRPLGHNLGLYTYAQQLIMAELAEFEDKREALYHLEVAGDELASIERKVVSLYIDVLQRKVAKFATVEVEVPAEDVVKAIAGDGSKTYLPMQLEHVRDFNFFRAAAPLVDQIKEIGNVDLRQVVTAGGLFLNVENYSVTEVVNEGGEFIQISGYLPATGIFNFAINRHNGDITSATRLDDGVESFEGLVFGWDVSWFGPGEQVHVA